ncbi:hypothetical protein [Methanocaldococcus sp.]
MVKREILERIENEKSIFIIGNDDEVKNYVIKKFRTLKDLDLSDDVLDSNKIEDENEKIVGVIIDDNFIVDTLTIALVRVYQKIDNTLKEKFDYLLDNMEIKLYRKLSFKGAPFFRVYIDGKRIISDRRILIRFSQKGWIKKNDGSRELREIGSDRFLKEIHVLESRIMKYLKR